MNICKRILSALLALCLILCPAPVSVGAADGAAVSVTGARAYPGNYACVYIEAAGLENLASLDLEIYYDSEALSVSSTSDGSLLSGGIASVNHATVGVIRLSAAWVSGVSGDGRLLTIWFQVADDCAPGDYPVRVAVGDAYDASLNPVSVSGVSGNVTVMERAQTTREFRVYSTTSSGTLRQGDTVTVWLVNQNYMPFAGLDVSVVYDGTLFEPVGMILDDALLGDGAIYSVNTSTRGLAKLSYASVEAVQTMWVAALELRVIADTDTRTDVSFSVNEVYDQDLNAYSCEDCATTLTLSSQPAAADLPDLTVSGGSADVGGTFTAVLSLEAGAAVAAADFTVRYDPAVLRCAGVTAADAVAANGGMAVISPNYADGLIRFSYINESGFDGGLELIHITLEALSSPESHYALTPGGSGVVDTAYRTVELDYVEGSGCVYGITQVPATCTEGGFTEYRCAACGDSREEGRTDPLGHSYSVQVTQPTCGGQGYTTHTCDRCGHSYTDGYVDALGHDYESVVTAPTCREKGYTTYTCRGCGHSYVDGYVPALGHDWCEWYIVVERTCEQDGLERQECLRCGLVQEGVLPATGHEYESEIYDPTCEEPGFTEHICLYCGDGYSDDYVDPLGHDWTDWVTAVEATCRQDGREVRDCHRCGRMEERILPATGHSFEGGVCVECGYAPAQIASGWSGSTTWVLTDDGTLTFTGPGPMRNYTYKSEMPWYGYFDRITRVVLEDGVTSIGSYAFYGMPCLERIEIPDTVTTIGGYAFKGSTLLDGVVLPAGLTRLGESAFYGCTALTAIDIPASLWTVQPYTFKNCTALASVTFHEGNLQKIADGAFYNTALTAVELPDCLDILDVYVFKNCSALASVRLSGSLTQIREAALYGTAIRTITIPEGVTAIKPYAFKNCVDLVSVDLPATLTTVDEAAFYACTTLASIDLPDAVTRIGNYAFRRCTGLLDVEFGGDLAAIGESSFYGCTGLTALEIPDGVDSIGSYAFKGCAGLTAVTLGSGVTTLGESAFHTCTGLKTLEIPGSVETIGAYCFSGSWNLWKLTFLGDAPAIGTGAFKSMEATAYYPGDNATWTDAVRQNYGGTITWKAR